MSSHLFEQHCSGHEQINENDVIIIMDMLN